MHTRKHTAFWTISSSGSSSSGGSSNGIWQQRRKIPFKLIIYLYSTICRQREKIVWFKLTIFMFAQNEREGAEGTRGAKDTGIDGRRANCKTRYSTIKWNMKASANLTVWSDFNFSLVLGRRWCVCVSIDATNKNNESLMLCNSTEMEREKRERNAQRNKKTRVAHYRYKRDAGGLHPALMVGRVQRARDEDRIRQLTLGD